MIQILLRLKRIKKEEVVKNYLLFKIKNKKETKDRVLEIRFDQLVKSGFYCPNNLRVHVQIIDNTFLPGYTKQLTQLLQSSEVTDHEVQYLYEPEE